MKGKKNTVTAEGTFKYYDETPPMLVIEGKGYFKAFYGDKARELFKYLTRTEVEESESEE